MHLFLRQGVCYAACSPEILIIEPVVVEVKVQSCDKETEHNAVKKITVVIKTRMKALKICLILEISSANLDRGKYYRIFGLLATISF